MLVYIIRRFLYAVPIVLGVLLLTFLLFFVVNKPDDMARSILGEKASDTDVEKWKREHNYHLPRFYNPKADGLGQVTNTLFFQKCARLLIFDFGRSDVSDRPIAGEIRRRMGPSLAITVPTFLLGMAVNITIALIVAVCRGTYLDRWGTVICVFMMSVSSLFYIIVGQFIFAQWLRLFPISGFDWGPSLPKFVFLPVLIGLVRGVGGGVRFYRTVMLEEVGRDYVRTARAKGLGEGAVLFKHVLKNAMVPILTNAVMAIPFLFMGSLLMESFFAVPGLGSMTITAIHGQDFAVIRAMVYIGSILFMTGLLLTDISYTLVDPRISLTANDTRNLYGGPSPMDLLKLFGISVALGLVVTGLVVGVRKFLAIPAVAECPIPIGTNAAFLLAVGSVLFFWRKASKRELWRNAWRQVRRQRIAMVSMGVLGVFVLIAALDSVSWRSAVHDKDGKVRTTPEGSAVYGPAESILDQIVGRLTESEKSYSEPLATHLLTEEDVLEKGEDGRIVRRRVRAGLEHPRGHLLGTDKTGQDVLYKTLKSVRTGLIIGALPILIAVPFAIFFGVIAGFFGGWIDEVVRYVYSTLSSIPGILLIVAFMQIFGQGLPQLCLVMGITGWVGLCRLLRAESMKLREREYVQAALALGVSKLRIIRQHVVPNLMHLVLISIVLRFSGLVLAEAVLSYVGVGVGPDTFSWGTMIDQARGELGREPMIWWSLAAAFVAMFALVLSTNLFGDALRDALDPRLRTREELA